MVNRIQKKQATEILKSLEDPVILSTNRGRFLKNDHCPNKMNAKNRRHSGWVTPRWAAPGKYSEAIEEGNEPQIYWDDWNEIRDGLRYDADASHIRGVRNGYNKNNFQEEIVEVNKKLKKLVLRRKAQLKNEAEKIKSKIKSKIKRSSNKSSSKKRNRKTNKKI